MNGENGNSHETLQEQNTSRLSIFTKEFSSKTAYRFLQRLEKRIDFVIKNPEAGKLSDKRKDVRSVLFTPHNQIFYRYHGNTIEILCLFDMRKNPKKKPY